MPIYEYEFGVWVEAEDDQDAWEQVRLISEELDAIDVEGESATDGPYLIDEGKLREPGCDRRPWAAVSEAGCVEV